jgi:hypothetical protein
MPAFRKQKQPIIRTDDRLQARLEAWTYCRVHVHRELHPSNTMAAKEQLSQVPLEAWISILSDLEDDST